MNGIIHRLLDLIFNKKVIINCDRDPYLHRWYIIRTRALGVFIHKFIRSDEDRALHDHPWNFLVIPIWRGYYEHHECDMCYWFRGPHLGDHRSRVLPFLGTRFRRGTYRHRVELLPCDWTDRNGFGPDTEDQCPKCQGRGELPSWSIFIRFREFREWGFWMPEGFIQWNKWWQEKCE